MSRADLAAISGVSYMQIWNLENGRTLNPQQTTQERFARAFGVDVPADVAAEAEREVAAQGPGSLIEFDPHDEGSLPMVASVYVFYDTSERPVYVGVARGRPIRDRVREHY
jgi:transcriptional regulator with XRE-family HTH domain